MPTWRVTGMYFDAADRGREVTVLVHDEDESDHQAPRMFVPAELTALGQYPGSNTFDIPGSR